MGKQYLPAMGFKSNIHQVASFQAYTGDIPVCTCLNLRDVVSSTEIFKLLEILLSQLIGAYRHVCYILYLDLLVTQCWKDRRKESGDANEIVICIHSVAYMVEIFLENVVSGLLWNVGKILI